MEFAYDGGGLAKGGTVTLYIDGKAVGERAAGADHANGLLRGRNFRRRDEARLSNDAGHAPGKNAFNGTVNSSPSRPAARAPTTYWIENRCSI